MRFIVMVKATKESEAGVMPDTKLLEDMGKFNEELVKAGIMLAGEGLHPSSSGVRVKFDGDKRTVIDGPFAETKELVAGFWLWQVKSKGQALSESASRAKRDRDSSGVRGGGLRGGAHAGASRGRAAIARARQRETVASGFSRTWSA